MYKSRILALAMVAACTAGTAFADTQFINFEDYSLGKIADGDHGWQITNPNWDQEVVSGGIGGTQSWRLSNKIASGSYGDQPYSPALSEKVGETQAMNFFEASLDFSALAGGQTGEGVTISIDNGTGQRGNYMRIENVAGDQWKLYAFDFNLASDSFVQTDLGLFNAGETHNLGFSMLFNPGADNDVWKVSLDGTQVFEGRGWEDFFRTGAPTYGVSPVVYDRLLFRAGGTQTNGAVGVLFDNIQYSSTEAVPEPFTMALCAGGLLLALKRRRRR